MVEAANMTVTIFKIPLPNEHAIWLDGWMDNIKRDIQIDLDLQISLDINIDISKYIKIHKI